MNIGYEAKRAFQNFTGLGNYSRAIIQLMSRYLPDNQYFIYTPKQAGRYENFLDGVDNCRVITPEKGWKRFPSLWRSAHLSRRAELDNLDIFHGLSHEIPLSIHKKNVKTFVTMHDLIAWHHPEYFPFLDRKIYQKKQLYACKSADYIIAISEQTKQDIVDIMGISAEKIKVVYQPCDPIFTQPVSDEAVACVRRKYHLPAEYVLSLGSIEPRKNLLSLVRALPQLPDNVHVVAVGRHTAYADSVLDSARELGVLPRLRLIHNAEFGDFPALYRAAAAFVYPSFYEGFGIPVLEALSCGTPTITSNCSSLPEVGGGAALYTDPHNPEMLAEQLCNLLNDKALHQELSYQGKERAKLFSPQNIATALWETYFQC